MKISLKTILRNAVYAAIYVVLCLVFAPISYGLIQVRVAEALCIMPLFDKFAIISISVGCCISNILNGSIVDAIFGTLATFIGLISIKFIKAENFFIKMLPTILSNAIIIPFVLKYAFGINELLIISGSWIAVGEIIAVYIIGYPLYKALKKIYKKFL